MTQNRSFKSRVRERMIKTGERYTTARARVLRSKHAQLGLTAYPWLLSGYDDFGGIQNGTAIAHNLLKQAGIRNPETGEPYSEPMLNGLAGGPGFMYAVFEYRDTAAPLLTITMRNKSMPELFLDCVFERAGVSVSVDATASTVKADHLLDEALEAGKGSICTVDMTQLPYYHMPDAYAGMAPHQVGVAGRDGDRIWIDDRSSAPRALSTQQFSMARAAQKRARNRIVTVNHATGDRDLHGAILDSIRHTIYGYETGDVGVPAQFRLNCGFDGMEKWRRLLTDRSDKKGWPSLFPADKKSYVGLRRAYDCVQFDDTAAEAGRPLFAEFLDEAAGLISGGAALVEAAEAFREAGAVWGAISALISNCDPVVAAGCATTDRIVELLDSEGYGAGGDSGDKSESHTEGEDGVPNEAVLRRFWDERLSLTNDCCISAERAATIYEEIAEHLEKVIGLERRAVDALRDTVGWGGLSIDWDAWEEGGVGSPRRR